MEDTGSERPKVPFGAAQEWSARAITNSLFGRVYDSAMTSRALRPAIVALLLTPLASAAQGVVVDQGRFAVTLAGRSAGTEEFTIRRAGLGGDAAIFANGTLVLHRGAARQEIRPLLRATAPDGFASQYQVQVVGVDSLDLRLRRTPSRFVAVIQSSVGEEQREFPAERETRILDVDVAHHYYFLRDARPGSVVPVLEPRLRTHALLEVGASADDELRLGQSTVPARRVELRSGEELRTVWYDRLGRVLRVEVPSRGYVAERVDLLR